MKRAQFYLGEQLYDMANMPGVGLEEGEDAQMSTDAAAASKAGAKKKRKSSSSSAPVYFSFDESTATRISSSPLQGDPFERLCVYVSPSTLGPQAEEGLFARRPLPGDTVVTWYSGTRDKASRSERRRWAENSNTIALIDDVSQQADIDIDVSAEWASTDKYSASLAHKCNHTFDPAAQNAAYCMALHPRFGLIKAIRTLRPLRAQEELLVDYGYSVPLDARGHIRGRAGPEWYRMAHAEHKNKVDAQAAAATGADGKGSAAAASGSDAKPAAKRRGQSTPAKDTEPTKAPASKRRKR